jgi:hypothetical protein
LASVSALTRLALVLDLCDITRRLELTHEHGAHVGHVLPETELAVERQVREVLGMVLQEEQAVPAVGLLVGQHDVRFAEFAHELPVGAAPNSLHPLAPEARHGANHSDARPGRQTVRARFTLARVRATLAG